MYSQVMKFQPVQQWAHLQRLSFMEKFILKMQRSFVKLCTSALFHSNHHVDYPQNAYAYSIEDVVEFVQGSTGIPYEIRELKTAFDDALTICDLNTARTIVDRMIEKFGADNSEVKIALAELDAEETMCEE